MRSLRITLASGLVGSVLVAVQAAAAPPPCKLVTDGAGDAPPVHSERLHDAVEGLKGLSPVALPLPAVPPFPNVQQGPSSDVLDITSADVAADKKWVTAVIRVKKLAPTAPTAAPTGITWFVTFTADSTDFVVAAHTDPTGAVYFDAAYQTVTGGSLYAGGPIGKLDLVRNEVRIHVPTDVMAAQATVKPGLRITNIAAGAANEIAVFDKANLLVNGGIFEWAPINTDVASTKKSYVVGAKSCVTPGK